MKKLLMVIFIVTAIVCTKSYAKDLSDIATHWAKGEIEIAVKNEIVNGYSDGTFKPNKEVTVAEFLKILIKSAHFDLSYGERYTFPELYMENAILRGIVLAGEFENPNAPLSRNEMSKIVSRYINASNEKKNKIKFTDVSKEYEEYILNLASLGVISGYEDKTFRGENYVTRAETIVIINRGTNIRRKLSLEKEIKLEKGKNYTNYDESGEQKTSYYIKNKKLFVNNIERYDVSDYEIGNKNISASKAINIIKKLVGEDEYVMVSFIPSDDNINRFTVSYAENECMAKNKMPYFSITYFENETLNLKEETNIPHFSDKCYMKIEVQKLWRDLNRFNSGDYVDECVKERLKRALEVEFGNRYSNDILKYIIQKNTQRIANKGYLKIETEEKHFGNYTINYYQSECDLPAFYVSR